MKPGGLWAFCLLLALPGELAAQRFTTDVSATARLLAELIRIDTSNPPGDEAKVAELLAGKFEPLGFEIDVIPTPQEGKAHFIARLRGDGSRKPMLLAAHADVVGVEREKWTFDPSPAPSKTASFSVAELSTSKAVSRCSPGPS